MKYVSYAALLLGSFFPLLSFALEFPDSALCKKSLPSYKKPVMLTTTWGPAINLAPNHKNDLWIGPIPDAIMNLNLRFEGYFISHWGLYGGMSFSTYSPKNNWNEIFGTHIQEEPNYCGLSLINLNMNIECGVCYQTIFRNISVQARAGYGYFAIGENSYSAYNDASELEPIIEIRRNINPQTISLGSTIGYRLSRVIGLVIDVGYRIPVTRSQLEVSSRVGDAPVNYSLYSKSWGNDLTLSLGVQLMCEGSRKNK